jgi:MYXO-CTERM domain-containing protein
MPENFGRERMKYSISGLAFACLLLGATSVSAQTLNIADLYSTGVDTSSAPIARGTVDSHWETSVGASPWQSAIQEFTNYCGTCGNIWVNHPIGDDNLARPLAHPDYIQQAAPGLKFSWRTTFNLPTNAALDTVTISYKVGFDDASRNAADNGDLAGCNHTVWVNGTGYELAAVGNNQRTECAATIPTTAGFVAGQNTLEFRISNLATYYGFRFEKVSAIYELQRTDLDIFNTGVDGARVPVAAGTTDTHWEVAVNSLAWMSAIQAKTNFCGSCGSIWVNHPIGNDAVALPLAHPSYVQTTAPGNVFSWRQTFDIPATADLSTINIKYLVGFDDASRNATDSGYLTGCDHTVWVNGVASSVTAAGNNQRTTCVSELPANANFVHGANTIEFRIQNIATYYGFRFELDEATFQSLVPPAAITITSPMDFDATADATPTITGTATSISVVEVFIFDDAGNVVQTLYPTVNANGTWTVDAAALAEGSYTLEATSTIGNDTATAGPLNFEVDITAPVVSITAPTDGTTVYSSPVSISGDSDNTADAVTLVVTDSTGAEILNVDPGFGTFTTPLTLTQAGDYTIELTATDALGNASSSSVTFTFGLGLITITSPVEGAMTDANPMVAGTTEAVAEVSVWLDGAAVGTATVDGNGGWTYALTNLMAGSHTVQGQNAAGDVSSETRMFTVQMVIVPASAAITSPAEGATLDAGSITVSGTGEPNTTVVVTLGDAMQTVTVDANGDWSATFTDVAAGENTVTATGADATTTTVSITVAEVASNNGTNNGTNNSTNNGTNNGTNNSTNNGTTGTNDLSGGTEDGCGCASANGPDTSGLLFLLGLLGLRFRRRR